jgi:methylated-DNA-[protein]-cysteine S-methyltransferase
MLMEKAYFYKTGLGRIFLSEDGEGISGLSLAVEPEAKEGEQSPIPVADYYDKNAYELNETELIREAAAQLMEYLEGKRTEFNIKLNPKGTQFQQKVWEALREIPYGETRSYQQIAGVIGKEKAARAVGRANHNNPIMIFIPCHRVIGADKSLVGFGAGLDIKEKLLNLEKQTIEIHN